MDWDSISSNRPKESDVSLTKLELIKRQYIMRVVSGALNVSTSGEEIEKRVR